MLDCLVNGEIAEQVPVTDRGLHYGDGIFETLAVLKGAPRFWQGHVDRMTAGCSALGLLTVPQSLLLREVLTVSAGHNRSVVKVILTRGEGGRGYAPVRQPVGSRIVIAYPFPDDVEQKQQNGVAAQVCDVRFSIQPALAGIKHLNRLEQVLASAELKDPRVQEGILLDAEDKVVSATAGNLFLVNGERLLTPRMDRCGVRGVLRAAILQAFKSRCEQRRVSLDMLPEADEVFYCNAVRGVVPVTRIGHWEYGIGGVTRELQQWLADR